MKKQLSSNQIRSSFAHTGITLTQTTVQLDMSKVKFHLQRPRAIIIEASGTHEAAMRWEDCENVEVSEPNKLLWEFMQLRQAHEQEIINFVNRWGILGAWGKRESYEEIDGIHQRCWVHFGDIESFILWRQSAMQVFAVMNVLLAHTDGNDGLLPDWENVCEASDLFRQSDMQTQNRNRTISKQAAQRMYQRRREEAYGLSGSNITVQRERILKWINRWLPEIEANVGINIVEGQPVFSLTAFPRSSFEFFEAIDNWRPLKAIIALELLQLASRGVYICDICGQPFSSDNRKLRPDRARFCNSVCRAQAHSNHVKASRKRRMTGTTEES